VAGVPDGSMALFGAKLWHLVPSFATCLRLFAKPWQTQLIGRTHTRTKWKETIVHAHHASIPASAG